MIADLDVAALTATVVVSGIVSFAVSGLLKQAVNFTTRGWNSWRDRVGLLRDGDHLVIGSGSPYGVGPGSASSRVRVRLAPARELAGGRLDPDMIEAWLANGVSELLYTSREHCDPDDLVRYVLDDFVAEVRVNGLIDVTVPVADLVHENPRHDHELDLASVVNKTVAIVASRIDGAYVEMFPDRLRSDRLDWHFDVSREPHGVLDPYEPTPVRIGLVFPGREPDASTPGQRTPIAGDFGFGSPRLRSVPIGTDPVEIVSRFVRGLIERSGYTGYTAALEDIRSHAVESLTRYRQTRDSDRPA